MSRDSIKDLVRQNISPFISGPETEAVIGTMVDEGARQEKLAVDASNTMYISTAPSFYLDRRISEVGITVDPEIGLSDFVKRNLAIDVTATKQVIKVIHDVLEIFYGPEYVRAFGQSQNFAPYNLINPTNGQLPMLLEFEIDKQRIVYQVLESDFPQGSLLNASAEDVAAAMTKSIRSQGSSGFAEVYIDPDTNRKYIRIYSGSKGPTGIVKILSGDLIRVLGLPAVTEVVNLTPPSPTNCTWDVLRIGSTVRFTFNSGSQPSLEIIDTNFYVNLNDTDLFGVNLFGSFPVTRVVAGTAGNALFEIEAPECTLNVPLTYIQTNVSDLTFFKRQTNKPYFKKTYALGWEPNENSLKVFLPASTRAVYRGLEGAAHMHLGKSTSEFNGKVYGNTQIDKYKLEILTPHSFAFTPSDYEADVWANGGILSVDWSDTVSYEAGSTVRVSGQYYKAKISNTNTLVSDTNTWEEVPTGAPIEYIRRDDGRVLVVMDSVPHGIGLFESGITNRMSTGQTRVLTTDVPHNMVAGNTFNAVGIDANFDGTSLTAINGIPHQISTRESSGSVRTLTTLYPHNLSEGDEITVSGINANYNGIVSVIAGTTGTTIVYNLFGFNEASTASTGIAIQDVKTEGNTIVYQMGSVFNSADTASSGNVRISNSDYKLTSSLVEINGVTITEDDPVNTFLGPYVYDPTARYELTSFETDLMQNLVAGRSYSIIDAADSSGIPDTKGFISIAFGSGIEEAPVPIIGTLPNGKIRLDPSYVFKNSHLMRQPNWSDFTTYNTGERVFFDGGTYRSKTSGNTGNDPTNVDFWEYLGPSTTVTYLSNDRVRVSRDGSDYPLYVTGIAEAREFCADIIEQISALGIKLELVVLYPDPVGLGNYQAKTVDKTLPDQNIIIHPPIDGDYQNNDIMYCYDV